MQSVKQIKSSLYDKYSRDKNSQKFYSSPQWRAVRDMKLSRDPCCQSCEQEQEHDQIGKVVKADVVHHLLKITTPLGWEHRLDLDYLVSVCHACHNRIETEMEKDIGQSS